MMKDFLYSTVAAAALAVSAPAQAQHIAYPAGGEVRHVNRYVPMIWDNDMNRAKALRPTGGDFLNHLILEYRDLTKYEADEMLDWTDADYFAEKTLAVAAGERVDPEPVSDWNIQERYLQDLTQARNRLMTAFANGARTMAPADAAVAQVSYDCWIEQQEENWQANHILVCRKQFEAAMARLDLAMQPAPQPTAAVPQPEPKMEVQLRPVTELVTVYFDFDKAGIRTDAQRMLDGFVDSIVNKDEVEIVVVGHTDRAGSSGYNVDLSQRRADAVKGALIDKGLRVSELKSFDLQAKGESEPAVVTADGVPEQANRRVILRGYRLEQMMTKAER